MNTPSSLSMQVAVAFLPKLNSFTSLPLIERCGSIEGIFHESEKAFNALCEEFYLMPQLFPRKEALQKAHQEAELIDKHNIRICTYDSPLFPERLKQCPDAPLLLFYKGKLQSSSRKKYLAIVGTRHASQRCQELVTTVVQDLHEADHHPVIVSGLAFGIDAAAHRASLQHACLTYAVLGHGLHMIYPAAHKSLAEKILAAQGALISEFPCTAPTLPNNFLQRNRIVAGLSQAVLIAESAEKGGAMATARMAFSYDREVMAFPGRPDDRWSAGCNLLIKENIAALVENGSDVMHILGWRNRHRNISRQMTLDLFDTSGTETTLLQLLVEKSPYSADELSALTSIPAGELSALLLKLELEGKIISLPGKKYALK